MKSKILFVVMAIAFCIPAFARTQITLDNIIYELKAAPDGSGDGVATVIGNDLPQRDSYNSPGVDLSIPESVTHEGKVYKVTDIGASAFESCGILDAVYVPATVEFIRSKAFRLVQLQDFYLASDQTIVSPDALSMSMVKRLILPETMSGYPVTAMVKDNILITYSKYDKIEDDVILSYDGEEVICAFVKKQGAYEIPASVTIIDNNAFLNCDQLTVLSGGASIESIGNSAFRGCKLMTGFTAGSDLKSIGADAFRGCASLSAVHLADKVRSVGDHAFAECTALSYALLGAQLSEIGAGLFYGCSSLSRVDILCNIDVVPEYMFAYCALSEFPFPGVIKEIGQGAFFGNQFNILKLPEGLEVIGGAAFRNCSLHTVYLPSTLKEIKGEGFFRCYDLQNIYCLSSTPPEVGEQAFWCSDRDLWHNKEYYESRHLYVPASTDHKVLESYKAHAEWGNYTNIHENAWPASMVSGTLPVIYINTENATPIVDKETPINAGYYMDPMNSDYEAEGSVDAPIALTIRGRGNSTWLQPKKPYKLKFDKKQSLFGLPKSKHYALMAHSFADGNVWETCLAGFEMSRMLGMGWAPHMVAVELVLNGRYDGVYFLSETIKIDEKRLNIFEQQDGETDPEIIPYGWLVEIDNNGDEYQYGFEEQPGAGMILFTYKTPEELSQPQKDWLFPELEDLNARVYDSPLDNPRWAEKLDVNTLAMYSIVREVLHDFDGYSGSFYMHKDKTPDAKWTFGPMWDCSMYWEPKDNYLPFSRYANSGHRFKWMPRIMQYSIFGDAFRSIWKEFYTPDNMEKLANYLFDFSKDLGPAFEANNERWKDELKSTQLFHAPTDKYDYVMNMLLKNAAWIDAHQNIEEIARAAAGVDEIEIDADAPEEFFTIDGVKLPSRPTAPGIYILRKGSRSVKIAL